MRISDIEFQLSRIPLPGGTWGDQIHTVTHIEIVTADITADDGSTGTGFTHTSGVGGRTILAMLEELRPTLLGKPAHPRSVWHDAWHYLRDNGPGGVTTLALAAVDIALWDLVGKSLSLPLADVLGRVRDRVPLYGSGINLHLSAEEVADMLTALLPLGLLRVDDSAPLLPHDQAFEPLRVSRRPFGLSQAVTARSV